MNKTAMQSINPRIILHILVFVKVVCVHDNVIYVKFLNISLELITFIKMFHLAKKTSV